MHSLNDQTRAFCPDVGGEIQATNVVEVHSTNNRADTLRTGKVEG